MIKFENVNVTMQGKRILSDINLEIQDGEFVLICGGKWMWKNHNDKTD